MLFVIAYGWLNINYWLQRQGLVQVKVVLKGSIKGALYQVKTGKDGDGPSLPWLVALDVVVNF